MNEVRHIFKKEIRPQSHVYRVGKRIVREIEFAMYLDGELQGYARSYLDAELTLNAIVYERLISCAVPTLEEAAAARAEIVVERKAA